MLLVYGLTVVIVGAWVIKSINQKSFIINRTPLDIPLLLFLGANILSTIFSIDTHTSIWGYYSRSNGGLLSIISYLLLYFAFVSNFPKDKLKTLFKFALASGLIISIWGIFEHFGVSPSCVILRGEVNASCWVQDVQARVFATLGQPNWMAAYLSMLIFPALYFFLTEKNKLPYYILLITYYLAFTFTYSRGPTLGLIGGMVVSILLSSRRMSGSNSDSYIFNWIPAFAGMTKQMVVVLISFLFVNVLFGSALTSFRLVSKFATPARPSISLPATPQSGTQLETGGTESGQIRFIVWRGALDIFKHYPIFGSGLETFAYSYYQFRLAAHNLVSEWDFLYNKAHNEYLNYLATTGVVGFGTYTLVIGTFLVWSMKYLVIARNEVTKQSVSLARSPRHVPERYMARDDVLFVVALLASYISYLIYNFFLFSVVIIALFFYLFPALAFVATESLKVFRVQGSVLSWIYRRPMYTRITKGLIILITIYLLFTVFKIWYADTLFAKGEKASDSGNPGRAYNLLSLATSINPSEPFFRSELAYSAAQAAAALKDEDASRSASLKDEAEVEMLKVLKSNPNNVSFLRSAIRTYFELSVFGKAYTQKTLEAINRATGLAPTDPKLYYNKALVLESADKKDESLEALKKALELKPNYLEAKEHLDEINR